MSINAGFLSQIPTLPGCTSQNKMWGFSLPFHRSKAPSAVRLLVCEHTQGSPGFMCLCAHPPTHTLPVSSLSPRGDFANTAFPNCHEPSLSGQHRALFHPLTVFPISLFKYRQLCMGMLLLTMKPVISTMKFPPHPASPPPSLEMQASTRSQ